MVWYGVVWARTVDGARARVYRVGVGVGGCVWVRVCARCTIPSGTG